MSDIDRRTFLQDAAKAGTGFAVAAHLSTAESALAQKAPANSFQSNWSNTHNRVWIGADYWQAPLQDWRIEASRLECTNAAANRVLHLLTHDLAESPGTIRTQVLIGRLDGGMLSDTSGSAGLLLGIQGPLREYRNSLIFGSGFQAGLDSRGLFLEGLAKQPDDNKWMNRERILLRFSAEPVGNAYRVTLESVDAGSGEILSQVERVNVPAHRFTGNVGLMVNYPSRMPRTSRGQGRPAAVENKSVDRFWFADWKLSGTKVQAHPERAFGPILFSQYTLSNNVMTMTAQMPPLGDQDSPTVRLQLKKEGDWVTVNEQPIHRDARTATFRLADWDDSVDVLYRLLYAEKFKDNTIREDQWSGTVRRDPKDNPVLSVADISCNIHAAFPNAGYVKKMAKLDPDLLAFTGDQFYESTGGYGVQRGPLEPAIIDYLRKWYLHGWTWRELTRDRPSISIPDDHDVYQGNVWGESGAPRDGTQERGGYDMPAEWVNVVHQTQTSHHPAPHDPTPIKQNISVYYGPMTYGRVSFAILADRMFKNGPEGKVPPTDGRGDHVTDPNFDPQTADLPGLVLLGDRQLAFLEEWGADWRGADMKTVVSQTIFTAMATTHGQERERLRADYDANGWPQTARSAALREIRKAFAFHMAGDQHLPAVVHYGIDEYRDGSLAFAGPAVNVGYPRWFEPDRPGDNRKPGAAENTGDFLDHFGNRMTVLAVANGAIQPREPVLQKMHDKASGIGIVHFDKMNQKITIDCWPYLADPQKPDSQFPGWPITFSMFDNFSPSTKAWLPKIDILGKESPVVQVVDEGSQEIVYTLRIGGRSFQPFVPREGNYTIRIGEGTAVVERRGIKATSQPVQAVLEVELRE